MQYTVSTPNQSFRFDSFADAKAFANMHVRDAEAGEVRKWIRRDGATFLHIINLKKNKAVTGAGIYKLTPAMIREGRGRRATRPTTPKRYSDHRITRLPARINTLVECSCGWSHAYRHSAVPKTDALAIAIHIDGK